MIALYRPAADSESFERRYHDGHLPLVRRIPGLAGLEIMKVERSLVGEFPYRLIAVMSFPDRETFRAAMKSPEQAAAGRDLNEFAGDLVTVVQVETAD